MRIRKAGILSLAVALTLGLAGCGSSSTGGPGAGTGESGKPEGEVISKPIDGKLNVTWWTHNQPTFVAANKKLIAAFEAANPDVHIVYTAYPFDVFTKKLAAAYRAGNAPAIQQIFGTNVTGYARKGLLDPAPAEVVQTVSDYWPAAIGAYEHEGKYYGLPHEFNLENGGMLVDPAKLQQAGVGVPKTWNELVSGAQKLTKVSNGKAEQVGFAFSNNDSITFLFLSMLLEQGADYWTPDGKHVDFSSDAAKRAFTAETDLVTKHKVDSEKWYEGDSFDVFFRGQAAMAMRGPWSICAGRESFPKQKFEYVSMPTFTGGKPVFAAESGWGDVVNAKAPDDQKKAAWDFIAFMNKPENLIQWNVATCTIPAVKSLQNHPELSKAIPGVQAALDVLPHGKWVGPVGDRDTFWKAVHDAYTTVLLGKGAPESALKTAEKQINQMLDEQQQG